MSISVLILTLDEEQNLGDCLDSVAWSDDVVVYDSFSRDGTERVARSRGARFYQRAFDDYAAQRTAALETVEYRHEWVLMLDADERVPPELRDELLRAARSASPEVALFRMRRKDMLFGRWLRRSSGYPTWFGRLLRRGRVRITRAINEQYETDGAVRLLEGCLVHYPFNKGMDWWVERHNRYSRMEAEALDVGPREIPWSSAVSADPAERRRFLKRLAGALPGRPFLTFAYLYLLRGGFLDGSAGYIFATLRLAYELMIDAKVAERRRARLTADDV